MTDGWEPGPNPVARIIAVRTAQVGGAAAVGLAGLGAALPPDRLVPLALGGGGAVTAGLSAYFVATFYAHTRFPGARFVRRLPPSAGNAVALTFDDGPHPGTTPRLLDALAAADARATFFVVGERAAAYPRLTRRIAEAGHAIGVHGLRHRTMVLQSGRDIAADLAAARRRIEDAAGAPLATPLLRPPYGFKTWTLARIAGRLGWNIVGWSLDPRDYDPQTPDALAARVVARLAPGEIVLLHERPGDPTTAGALPVILDACRARNLACVALKGDASD